MRPGLGERSEQPGQVIVELALGLTVLLLLTVGIVEFAPAVVRAAQLTQAVRDGVAVGRTAPNDTFAIRKRVANSAPSIYGTMTDAQITAMTDAQIAVTCSTGLAGATKACSSAIGGDSISVTAVYNYQTITGLFSVILAAPIEITRSATSEIF
jgi:Flp pilus assembly protein TadG